MGTAVVCGFVHESSVYVCVCLHTCEKYTFIPIIRTPSQPSQPSQPSTPSPLPPQPSTPLQMPVLPITYDPVSKKVTLDTTVPLSQAKNLTLEVTQINTLYADFIKSNAELPPLPTKENFTQNLSVMIKKMHESATALMRQRNFTDAAKKFDIALGLASARSKFEAFQATLPEIMICLMGRCDAYNNCDKYSLALQDAEILILLGSTIPDNHLRRGIANLNLGEFLAAKSDFQRGLAFNPSHPILIKLLSISNNIIDEYNGDL